VLKATFLLEYGGRMWSLVHKPSGRELLYVNPMFQPANLAIAQRWVRGGRRVEHGRDRAHAFHGVAGIRGAGRSAGLHAGAAAVRVGAHPAGGLPDRRLPAGRVAPCCTCASSWSTRSTTPFPMYGGRTSPYPEAEDVRVLVPAVEAYAYALSVANLKTVAIPVVEGKDISYTTTASAPPITSS